MKIKTSDILLILSFIAVGILTRTTYHLGANIEFVTALSIVAPVFLHNKKLGLLVPFGIMLGSDLVLGNTIIFAFTWTGFLFAPVLSILLSKIQNTNNKYQTTLKSQIRNSKLGVSILSALSSNVVFFLWTNLGVVLTTTMYEKSLGGLMQSYINALPFFRNQLISGMLFTPIVFLAISFTISLYKSMNLQTKQRSQNHLV